MKTVSTLLPRVSRESLWQLIGWLKIWAGAVLCPRSVVSDSLRPHGLQLARLLCPWDSPGKSTGGGCHALLQIFLTQGSNPRLLRFLHLQADYLSLCTWEAIFKEMSHAVDKLERQKQELGFSTAASAYLFSLPTDRSE